MHLVLGIDTGGTFTDGVLLDSETREIRTKAKAFTTREDLSLGIRQCINNMTGLDPKQIKLVLSTTLATNAIVEGRGCRQVAGTAKDGLEALEKARLLHPDVILMDISMPRCSGLEAIRPIKAEMPGVKIVMLTTFDDDENLFEAVKRGASCYLLKDLKA